MKPRVLVFMLAYNAEKTTRGTLVRIPAELAEYDTHVLFIDDGSTDETTRQAMAFKKEAADFPFDMTVLTNPVNQGYGGNIKIGMHYAAEHGYDALCLVHADGQYPPEAIPELVKPILDNDADVVFGSRMMEGFNALKGGMPLYKFIGNKILTWIENRFLGLDLSEYHTGFRLYSVAALKRIPFHLNADDFHFDTEIIIQCHLAGFRFSEKPIPTFYGEEVSHVNGLDYAWKVTQQTLLAYAQNWNLCYQRKYDVAPKGREVFYHIPKMTFTAAHRMAVEAVPDGAKVLDICSADGLVVEALKKKGYHVTGIDREPPPETRSPDAFFECDVDILPLPVSFGDFDCILLLDVLGHLTEPEKFIEWLHSTSSHGAETLLIATSGNIGFVVNRLQLLFGFFNYGKRGILDRSHTRLFTFKSFKRLLEEGGFRVEDIRAVEAPFQLAFGDNSWSRFLKAINRVLIGMSRGLFGYRIFIAARAVPTLEYLLDAAHGAAPSDEPAVHNPKRSKSGTNRATG